MQKYKYLLKNIGILAISNFASKILVFLLVPLYTSVLTTEEYGIYEIVFSAVQIFIPIFTLNILGAVMRYAMDNFYKKDEVVAIALLHLLISVTIAWGFFFINRVWGIYPNIKSYDTLILGLFISYIWNQFFSSFAKGMERIKEIGIASLLGTITLVGGNLYFLLVVKAGLKGFFLANILAQAVPSIYYIFCLKIWNYIKLGKLNRNLQKKMLLYSIPLVFTDLCWWANNAFDKYAVAFICGTAVSGVLSVAYKIPSILSVIGNIVIQAWQISAIKEYGAAGTKEFYGKIFWCVNFSLCLCGSVLIMLSDVLAKFLFANDFYIAWKYIPFLLVASAINTSSGMLGPILAAQMKSKSMAKAAVWGLISNFVLNICFIYAVGVQGATVATVFSSFVIYAVRKKEAGNEIAFKNYGKTLFAWGLLCLQSVVEIFLMSKWIQGVIFLIILMLHLDGITKLLSSFNIKEENK